MLEARTQLKPCHGADAKRLAEDLWCWVTQTSRTKFLLGQDTVWTRPQEVLWKESLEKLSKGFPLAYLEGSVGFYGRDFFINESVLIPRCDSEVVVEIGCKLASRRESGTFLDLGTGSGCLVLSLVAECPGWLGLGVDRSAQALEVAQRNSERLHMSDRVSFQKGDWLTDWANGPVDIMVANPPYVLREDSMGPGVAEYEPAEALFVPSHQPLEPYQAILSRVDSCLVPGGHLVFEVGAGRAEEVAQLMVAAGFLQPQIANDLGGVERVVYASRPLES